MRTRSRPERSGPRPPRRDYRNIASRPKQGLSLAEIFSIPCVWASTAPVPRESQGNISHPIRDKCHSLLCGYRLALQQDDVTIPLSHHSYDGRKHSGQIINSTFNDGDDHESQDQCKSRLCSLHLLPACVSSKSARRPKGRRAPQLDQD
jgi:hypothetical protein